jgi:hypothetical protein
LGFIVLNDKMLNGAEFLCAPLREPLRSFALKDRMAFLPQFMQI